MLPIALSKVARKAEAGWGERASSCRTAMLNADEPAALR